jgi:hypothetical protein
MFFLEVAAQSVRGFSPSVRAALKPGYVALRSPTELPAPLAGLVLSIAYPDGRGGDAAFLAPGARSGRAGLSIQGPDGSIWRLVRDLGGAGGLHKLNRTTNQFEAVTQDAQEMAQVLRQGAGFVSRTTWEQLFTLTGPQLPTRRPRATKPAGPPTPEKPRLASSNSWVGLEPTAAPADAAARIAELEQELKAARTAADLQFKLDGYNADIYALDSKVRGYEELKARLEQARAELASAPTPKSIGAPDDIIERARRYGEEKKRYEQALRKLYDERDQALNESAIPVEPLTRNQNFLLAVGSALVLLLAAAFVGGGLRYLALLSVVPGSLAALLALRWVEALQRSSREGAKGEVFAQREKRLTDEFKLASSVVESAFAKVGAVTTDEFLTAMSKAESLRPAVAQLELEFADYEADPEIARLPAQLAQLKAEAERLNEQLLSMSGGYVRDVRDIERELASLRAPAEAPRRSTGEFAAIPTGPTETFEDPTPALLVLATDLFHTDVPSLWSVLRDRVVQYLAALTDRRYHGVDVTPDGHATLQAPGRELKAGELPGKDLDLYYFALRLTLIEKSAPQAKQPVVIEDTFNTVLDAAKQPLFGRMVKHLGTLTQVLHVSGAGQNAALADTPVAL